MSTFGALGSQRAPDELGKEVRIGPHYHRSMSLTEVQASNNHQDPISLFKIESVDAGDLRYHSSDDDNVVHHVRGYGALFRANVLGDVDNKEDGDLAYQVNEDFFPALYQFLKDRKANNNFVFRGRAEFLRCLMEWTEQVLLQHQSVLNKSGIYGVVSVSRYPFLWVFHVWRAFSELWGPLSNTFHHSSGDMGISLYDLKVIGGLPILGVPYEEFIPPNEKLMNGDPCCSTTAELLRIHAQICDYLKHKGAYDRSKSMGVSWKQ